MVGYERKRYHIVGIVALYVRLKNWSKLIIVDPFQAAKSKVAMPCGLRTVEVKEIRPSYFNAVLS